MSKHVVQTLLEASGASVRSYSGRGMYGRTCLGVTCESPFECIASLLEEFELVSNTKYSLEDVILALKDAQMDNMGLDVIVYFPRIAFVENDKDEDEVEADDE